MARPRKMKTEDMLAIVNEIYEEHGNVSRLKYSFLAEYATQRNFDAKAYDFRRNAAVRTRIEELGDLSAFFTEGTSLAYKGLDVDAFISRNITPKSLKKAFLPNFFLTASCVACCIVLLFIMDHLFSGNKKRRTFWCDVYVGSFA